MVSGTTLILVSHAVALTWRARLDEHLGEYKVELLASHAAVPIVRGVRHKPAAAAKPADARRGAPGSMDDPRWREGYALLARHGLSYDVQTPWWHLDAAVDLARDFPTTQIIVNHTGLPADRSPEALAAWRRALERAAAQPNIALKISGEDLERFQWSRWTEAREALEAALVISVLGP